MTFADRQSLLRVRTAAAAATTLLLVLIVGLVVQHYRHAWPFSLHHDVSTRAQEFHSAASPAAPGPDAHDGHPRAAVELDPVRLGAADLQMERVRVETIARTVRAVATVIPDERGISHVHTRVSGWIEELFVAATGEQVVPGQPLASIFSQDLYASQVEYLTALAHAGAGPPSSVAASARTRLKVLGMTDAEIAGIEASGEPRQRVTVTAPRRGVVLRRSVSIGTAVDPSTELLTLADLSTVWVVAELPESRMLEAAPGMPVVLGFGSTGATIDATVDFIYPTLSERTRSLRVRMVVSNPEGVLRPGMYGSALFRSQPHDALTVPRDAVVDTGARQHVFVAADGGLFEPRPVRLGVRLQDRVEILEGITEGEQIVTSGVFLLDSESRLRSVGGAGLGHGGHGASDATPDADPHDPASSHQP